MTWGEIQILSLQKMFLNNQAISVDDLETLKTDKKYAIYLNAMPATANEGIRIILSRGVSYAVDAVIDETNFDKELSNEKYNVINLEDTFTDYDSIKSVMVDFEDFNDYVIKLNKYLLLPKNIDGSIIVSYKTEPKQLTTSTGSNYKINLPIRLLSILPLYIASELYKDDDISLATIYRNQFEAELAGLKPQRDDIHFTSVNGWL